MYSMHVPYPTLHYPALHSTLSHSSPSPGVCVSFGAVRGLFNTAFYYIFFIQTDRQTVRHIYSQTFVIFSKLPVSVRKLLTLWMGERPHTIETSLEREREGERIEGMPQNSLEKCLKHFHIFFYFAFFLSLYKWAIWEHSEAERPNRTQIYCNRRYINIVWIAELLIRIEN